MKKQITLLLLIFSFCKIEAQTTNLVGVVINNKSGERIPFANIMVLEGSIGVSANSNGYFELSVPATKIIIRASAVGFESKDVSLELSKIDKKSILIKLDENIITTSEVTIEVERYREELSLTRYNIQPEQIKVIPFIAEPDPIRAMQALPGVTLNSDFNNKLFVRGGNFDETSITIDGVPLYNVNHFGSIVGSFNDDIFKNVKLYPSNYPVKYGGYLSGILEMETLDGKTDYTKLVAGFSLISSKIFAEGSVGQATYVLSARRTYYDIIANIYELINGIEEEIEVPTYFYDLFGKVSYPISKDFIIKVESFFSHDYYNLGLGDDSWYYKYETEKNTKPFWNTFMLNISGFYSMSDISSFKVGGYLSHAILNADIKKRPASYYGVGRYSGDIIVYIDNNIKDVSFYIENNLAFEKHNIKSGIEHKQINLAYDWILESTSLDDWLAPVPPQDLLFDYAAGDFGFSGKTSILSIYANDFFELMPSLFSNIGFRFAYLSDLSLSHFTPFINLKYYFTPDLSLNLGYASYYQYLYAIRDNLNKTTYAFSPMSVLFLVNDKNTIPASNHFSFGIEIFNLFSDYILNAEAYLKNYSNLMSSYNVEPIYRYEDGKSYGIDILFRKPTGFLTGWLAYTLSRSFKDNEGTKYYSSSDRTHNLKIIGDFNISSLFKIGFQYNYATGLVYTPISFATVSLDHDGYTRPYMFIEDRTTNRLNYGIKNSKRAANYSRLDISITGAFARNNFVFKPYLSIINVLNNENIFSMNYIDYGYIGISKDKQISSFIIPTIGITAEYQF